MTIVLPSDITTTPHPGCMPPRFHVVEFAGIPGCGKTTAANALRSRLCRDGIDSVAVRSWAEVYGVSRLSRLLGRPARYFDVLATTMSRPRLVANLWRRALEAGCRKSDGARWVCNVLRMQKGMWTIRPESHRDAGTIVLDSGICFSLTHFLHFGTVLPPPFERDLVVAVVSGVADGVVYCESNVAECYARALPRTGWQYEWIHHVPKEQMLAALQRMKTDLDSLINMVEAIGIPTLRVPWETTVDERVTLVEDWLLHTQRAFLLGPE